jgi:predicted HTH transcriptional regulator
MINTTMLSENNTTEFKRELNDKLEKTVISFLNSKTGGDIFIGVGDDGSVIGVKNIDKTQLVITDRIKNNISPTCLGLFDVYVEEKDDKAVRMAPFPVIGVSITTSKADILSVATIKRTSPKSYTSLTFPLRNKVRVAKFVVCIGFIMSEIKRKKVYKFTH